MCGLVGWFGNQGTDVPVDGLRAALRRMQRRGPDDEGYWQEHNIGLGSRRLAILDLDHRAAQPMHSPCGRFVIVFNGEIYNFRELRRMLERSGVAFRTTSDTEVVLALFSLEGEAMLSKLHGMFAFAIWDRSSARAFIARDPYGIKPLYVASAKDGLLVGSQVKALLATGLVSREPDLCGQAMFWMLGSVPEPRTWFRDVQALPSGHCAWIKSGRMSAPRRWQDIGDAWGGTPEEIPDSEVKERVRVALNESVIRHQVSDVPVGVFLSGGIDSSVLASAMVENGANEVQGITLTYDEFSDTIEDEAPMAAKIAAHCGMRHVVRRVSRAEFIADLPRILEAMDQPSIDGINTWYASKAAAESGLKVVVSGVGGDELFQGYSSFRTLPRMVAWRNALSWCPGAGVALRAAGRLQAMRSGNRRWRHLADWSTTIEGAWWLRRSVFAPEELAGLMGEDAANESLRDFDVVTSVRAMTGPLPSNARLAFGQIESKTYLRNQLLRDSDWASMDHSVELRTPLVDSQLLQCFRDLLPAFARFPGKRLLAEVPRQPLPKEVVERPKTGFGIPMGRWLAEKWPRAIERWAPIWAQELVRLYEGSA